MPLVAAALVAVVILALGAGTGAAQTDVKAAPAATLKVTLVTDIGGIDDRSFNFLANKGLQDAKKKLAIQGSVFISKSDRECGVAGREALPEGEVRDRRQQRRLQGAQGRADERARTALQGAGGRLPRRLPRRPGCEEQAEQRRHGRCGRRPEDPAGRSLHRRLLRGREEGLPGRQGLARLFPGLRRPGEVQGSGAQLHRRRRERRLPGRGPVRPRRAQRGEGEGRLGHRRRRRPGVPRHARADERNEEGRRGRLPDDPGGQGDEREVPHELQRNLHGEERRRRLRQDLVEGAARLGEGGRERAQADRRGDDQGDPAGSARRDGLVPPVCNRKGRGFALAPSGTTPRVTPRRLLPLALLLLALVPVTAGCGSDDGGDAAGTTARHGGGGTTGAKGSSIRVGLVTDIGGLDDRSFNFLANKGLEQAEDDLGVEGRVVVSKSNADYVPNLSGLARQKYDLVIAIGFLMADALETVAKQYKDVSFAIIDYSQAAMASKPANVRGLLFKEQEAG